MVSPAMLSRKSVPLLRHIVHARPLRLPALSWSLPATSTSWMAEIRRWMFGALPRNAGALL
eukprot:1147046-Lingulodinium_polyedra.AAC.1